MNKKYIVLRFGKNLGITPSTEKKFNITMYIIQ